MCLGFKRVGGGLLGSHCRLFAKLVQEFYHEYVVTFVFPQLTQFVALILSLPTLEMIVAFYFLSMSFQWWFKGCMAAAEAYLAWLDLPPPWPDEVYYHRFPRHHRKFGVYFKVQRWKVMEYASLLLIVACIDTVAAQVCQYQSISIHPLDIAGYSPSGWADSPPPFTHHPSPSDLPFQSFFGDSDLSQIMSILRLGSQANDTLGDPDPLRPATYLTTVCDAHCITSEHSSGTALIIDTGVSVCVTPHCDDFVSYHPSRLRITDLSSSNRVAGEGLVSWTITDVNNLPITVQLPCCHIEGVKVRLLSPQILLKTFGGGALQTVEDLTVTLGDGTVLQAKYCPRTRLPCLPTPSLPNATCFWSAAFDFSCVDRHACTSLHQAPNTNLTAAQKEVLSWHERLSHAAVTWVQLLMRDRKWLRARTGNASLHDGPFLPCSERGPLCDISGLKCQACLYAKSHRRTPSVHRQSQNDHDINIKFRQMLDGTRNGILKQGHLQPGEDCISADHYITPSEGRLYTSLGREQHGFTCGSLFVDHASGRIFNYCQFSTNANATIASKHHLEILAREHGITIKQYHSDNGVFASAAFKDACAKSHQKLTFSGIGAHHQNGVAERNIKTVTQWARANLLHASTHWPSTVLIKYWPQAIDYAVWVFNRMPSISTGTSPLEIWTQTRSTSNELRRAHVFGCPIYVLDRNLQDGKAVPKWTPRAGLGMFLGFSPLHSSLVPLVLNLTTGKISPQYHVIFDDRFETVPSHPTLDKVSLTWRTLLRLYERDCYLDEIPDDNGDHRRDPPSNFDWTSTRSIMEMPPPPCSIASDNPYQVRACPTSPPPLLPMPSASPPTTHLRPPPDSEGATPPPASPSLTPPVSSPVPFADSSSPDGALLPPPTNTLSVPPSPIPPLPSEGDNVDFTTMPPSPSPAVPPPSEGAAVGAFHPSGRPLRTNVLDYDKHGPAISRRLPVEGEEYELAYLLEHDQQPASQAANRRFHTPTPSYHHQDRLMDYTILQNDWSHIDPHVDLCGYLTMDFDADETPFVDSIQDPRLLEAFTFNSVSTTSTSKYNDDNPSFEMAMRGPFQAEFYNAIREELHTLYNQFGCWELVPRLPHMRVLPSTWAFKIKRYPDGSVKKFKARFCVC